MLRARAIIAIAIVTIVAIGTINADAGGAEGSRCTHINHNSSVIIVFGVILCQQFLLRANLRAIHAIIAIIDQH